MNASGASPSGHVPLAPSPAALPVRRCGPARDRAARAHDAVSARSPRDARRAPLFVAQDATRSARLAGLGALGQARRAQILQSAGKEGRLFELVERLRHACALLRRPRRDWRASAPSASCSAERRWAICAWRRSAVEWRSRASSRRSAGAALPSRASASACAACRAASRAAFSAFVQRIGGVARGVGLDRADRRAGFSRRAAARRRSALRRPG